MPAATSPYSFDVTQQNFEEKVLRRSREVPVLVDFGASWCEPCQQLKPVLEALAVEYAGKWVLAKVDIDRNQDLAMEFGVASVPTVIAVRDGRIVSHFMGALPEEAVRQFLQQVLPSNQETTVAAAEKLLETDPAAALALLDAVAGDDETVHALRASALIRLGRPAEARVAAQKVTEGCDRFQTAANVLAALEFSEQAVGFGGTSVCRQAVVEQLKSGEAHRRLGLCLAGEARYEDALASLLRAGELDSRLASSSVREAMVRIFQILGPQSELADRYRRELSSLLF